MNKYKLGSLFDGSGGFPLAGSLCGIEPAWASEVEPYPVAVTRSRFPNMKHLGDISKINGGEVEPVDIITFGSPCQDLSVAGKRAGLKHEANGDDETTRSGLFMEAVRIIREMKEATNGRYPTYALWENVPGAFSSNGGEDFRIVLEELIKIVEPTAVMPAVPKNGWPYADSYCGDGWSLAYRVFDAQYWGVPQRRRRIHLVLDLRGERAREVLFEREGVRGYFAEGRTPWQAVTSHAENCSGADDRAGEGFDGYNGDLTGAVSATLGVNCGVSTGRNGVIECRGDGGGRGLDAVVPYTLKIRSDCDGGGKGALVQEDKSATLATNNDQHLFQPIGLIDSIGGQAERGWEGDVSPTLKATHYKMAPCVAYAIDQQGGKGALIQKDKSATLATNNDQYLLQPVTLEPGIAAREGGHIYDITDYTSVVVYESHPMDSRVKECGEVSPTVTVKYAKGAADTPLVCEAQLASGKEVAGCLMASGYEKLGAQEMFSGDYTVVEKKTECLDVGFLNSYEEQSPTLLARGYKDPHLVAYAEIHPTHNEVHEFIADNNADAPHQQDLLQVPEGVARTIACGTHAAGSHLTKTVINLGTHYIVRRLTPTECARLQGFADRWGDIDTKDDFTDEEYRFWLEVRNTHATVIGGREAKEYTKEQMLKWYNSLHTDSAEYKMWGNGIALPPALYCMQGIRAALDEYAEMPVAEPDPKADVVVVEVEEPAVEHVCEEEPAPTVDPEKEKLRETLLGVAKVFGEMAAHILEVCK